MRIAIVGAGISGLSAARYLTSAGAAATVYEKATRVGGRVSTRVLEGYVFDSGASSITPRGGAIEAVMLSELDTHGLTQITKPIYTHNGVRIAQGDSAKNRLARYTYAKGNLRLPELLSEGLDIRLNAQVEGIERSTAGFKVLGEIYDALILTPPIPQAATLLWSLGESRPIANSRYRPCLSVLLGFDKPLDKPYHALLDPDQRLPLTWLCLESVKCEGRAPEGHCAMVAQLSAWYSLAHFSGDSQRIVAASLVYIGRLIGPGFENPTVSEVKRWKYAQPDSVALFDTVNPPGSRLIVAGDGVLAGRVENAFETGRRAAAMALESLAARSKEA